MPVADEISMGLIYKQRQNRRAQKSVGASSEDTTDVTSAKDKEGNTHTHTYTSEVKFDNFITSR